MKEKEILNLWQRNNDLMKNGQINQDQIDKLLKPRITRLSFFVNMQLFTYLKLLDFPVNTETLYGG